MASQIYKVSGLSFNACQNIAASLVRRSINKGFYKKNIDVRKAKFREIQDKKIKAFVEGSFVANFNPGRVSQRSFQLLSYKKWKNGKAEEVENIVKLINPTIPKGDSNDFI